MDRRTSQGSSGIGTQALARQQIAAGLNININFNKNRRKHVLNKQRSSLQQQTPKQQSKPTASPNKIMEIVSQFHQENNTQMDEMAALYSHLNVPAVSNKNSMIQMPAADHRPNSVSDQFNFPQYGDNKRGQGGTIGNVMNKLPSILQRDQSLGGGVAMPTRQGFFGTSIINMANDNNYNTQNSLFGGQPQ